nr:hypothetical protein [Tanacetum cinerariifolium]
LNGENVSWIVYKNRIIQKFGTVFDGYQSSAKEYPDAFDTLLSRVDVSEEHDVSFYLGRLPTKLEIGVRMFRLQTLVDAYRLTNLQEATLNALKNNELQFGIVVVSLGAMGTLLVLPLNHY